MRVLAILMAAGLFALGILTGSSLSIFVYLPGVIVVLGAMLIPFGVHGTAVLLPLAGLRRGLPEIERARALDIVHDLDRATFWGGALFLAIHLVQITQNLGDPNALGPAMAVVVLPIFYALALRLFVWHPLEARLRVVAHEGGG